mmetsp:Transcript_33469/g.104829  ORF Transcript_33469/g.104829 Transcript_33469/m.104829 type:complete len:116 (+) Transcript_33469:122-469(+)
MSDGVRRRWLRADLQALADSFGVEDTNMTELELVAAVTAKAALDKLAASERAAQLEASLAEAEQRADELSAGVKEISQLVGVGGFGGLFSMFMSEKDVLKETKEKVSQLVKPKKV